MMQMTIDEAFHPVLNRPEFGGDVTRISMHQLNPLQRETPAPIHVDIYSSRTHQESKPLSYIEYIITDWTQQLQVGTIFTGKGVIQQGFKDRPMSYAFHDFFFQETSHAFDFSF